MESVYSELLSLSSKKEIPYTKKQLEKMSEEKLQLIYDEYKQRELEEFNDAVVDITISKLDEYMKVYKFIKEDSQLGKKLQNKKLFRQDLKSVVSYVTPFLPFIGFIEGEFTIATEVFDKVINDNSTSKTEERNEQDKNSTEPDQDSESPED